MGITTTIIGVVYCVKPRREGRESWGEIRAACALPHDTVTPRNVESDHLVVVGKLPCIEHGIHSRTRQDGHEQSSRGRKSVPLFLWTDPLFPANSPLRIRPGLRVEDDRRMCGGFPRWTSRKGNISRGSSFESR